MKQMTGQLAQGYIDRSVKRAEEIGINVCISVVDSGAHLVAFYRMDKAFLGSIDVAHAKARTSSLFPLSTELFGNLMRSNNLTGMEETNNGLIGFPGGLPILMANEQIGAIGISGGSAEQDSEIASYALAGRELKL